MRILASCRAPTSTVPASARNVAYCKRFQLQTSEVSPVDQKPSLSRRKFAAWIAAAPIAAAQQPSPNTSVPPPQKRQGTVDGILPFQDPVRFTRKDVPARVQPFPMTQVRLLPSALLEAAEWNRSYMSRLPADRLLHSFRLNAGLPSNAEPLGGWEVYIAPTPGRRPNGDGELRGHFIGHFLSASAQIYASMGDKEAKARSEEHTSELAKCQQKLGPSGYLSAFPTRKSTRLNSSHLGISYAVF